jgi:hypothetical protein
MRVKALQGFANDLVSMAVADRARPLYRYLMDHADGTVDIDLVQGVAALDGVQIPDNAFVNELREWLAARFQEIKLTPEYVESARVSLALDSSTVPTDRGRLVHYLVTPRSHLVAAGGHYESTLQPSHVWVNRHEPDANEKPRQSVSSVRPRGDRIRAWLREKIGRTS